MENQTVKTAREFLEAVQNGDQAKLGALLHPDIKWHQPGNNHLSGTKQSNMEVFQMVGGMFAVSLNSLVLKEIKSITANGNQAACVLHWKAQRPGAVLDVDNVDVYTVENGQIVEATVYSADISQEDHFWGK